MDILQKPPPPEPDHLQPSKAFARLSQEFGLTQEQIGQRTGCDRSTVSNYMRLLKLPEDVQNLLRNGWLDFSQARCLLTLAVPEHISKLAKEAHEIGRASCRER